MCSVSRKALDLLELLLFLLNVWRRSFAITRMLLIARFRIVNGAYVYSRMCTKSSARKARYSQQYLYHWWTVYCQHCRWHIQLWSRKWMEVCVQLFFCFFLLLIPAKAREYVFTGIGLCLRLSVCRFVTTITKKIVVGFAPNFVRRFLREMGRISSCFVTIGRGMWSTVKKLCKPATVYKIALLGNSELAGRRIVSVASVGDTNAFAGICTLSEYFPSSFFVIFVTLKHKIKFLRS